MGIQGWDAGRSLGGLEQPVEGLALVVGIAGTARRGRRRGGGGGGGAPPADWTARRQAALDLIARADREGRPVQVLTTAPPADGDPLAAGRLGAGAEVLPVVQSMTPQPWASDPAAARAVAEAVELPGSASVLWLSDGLDSPAARELATALQRIGTLAVLTGDEAPVVLDRPAREGDGLTLTVRRAATPAAPERTVAVQVLDTQGRAVARLPLSFAAGSATAQGRAEVPPDLLNTVGSLSLEGVASAGAMVLLDDTWRRRPIGLASGAPLGADLPLLGDVYYLERALQPVAEVRRGGLDPLLDRPLSMLIIANSGPLAGPAAARLEDWVTAGGVLVRFAGDRLEENTQNDPLLPVRLRGGGGQFGGTLSWSEPVRLAPFPDRSPFAGLPIPADVAVSAQVLAEPSPTLPDKTWARLTDGTPLVTAEPRGQGWVVLFHTTANAEWSTLALSGLFPQMMERMLTLSAGVEGGGDDAGRPLPPLATLDGFGRLGEPPGNARALTAAALTATAPGPQHPPGYYGSAQERRSLNLVDHLPALAPLPALGSGIERGTLSDVGREVELRPWLLLAALCLALLDWIASYALRGLGPRLPGRRSTAGRAAALLLAAVLAAAAAAGAARAQETPAPPPEPADPRVVEAVTETRLAWVQTGDTAVDRLSEAGLYGLTRVLGNRSSAELSEPMAVDPEVDDLIFYPLVYWPVIEGAPTLSVAARGKVQDYLQHGGMILFDTRDLPSSAVEPVLSQFELPTLVRLPDDHVLTRSFYLLQETPGRHADVTVWVEREGSGNDRVSSVIIGNGDWAAAWARAPNGSYMAPVVPGGDRQREIAYRFGVNAVMYALTGNYKADQVHVPAIMERLTQ
ncbi:DUF4159 domain-containing protein [Caenispirillum bisanense]|uniref:DUF4159 domain-containing protein n=1 Tax=Caenispirillum bisanense TaxID=414052 RepID=UPI0031CE332D